MSLYDPSVSLNQVNGNVYDVDTEVEIPNGTNLSLESNTVTGVLRTIIYRVVGSADDDNYFAEANERISKQRDETSVKVVIKKDGEIKGEKTVLYS